jgi:hypothetical protein
VEICPLSGQLATESCRRDPQTPVHTELFAHGTEPLEWCPHHWHAGPAPLTLIASTTAPGIAPPAGPTISIELPPPAAGEAIEEIREEPAPRKKRGFWGRVFGFGRGDD